MNASLERLCVSETNTSFIIPNIRYRGQEQVYEVRKRILPYRTFEEHVTATIRAEEKGGYGVGDASLHFALFRALYGQRNEHEQRKTVEKARKFFARKLEDNWLLTLTQIEYRSREKAVVTHRQGMRDAQCIEAAIRGDSGYLDMLRDADVFCSTLYNASRDDVCTVMHWLTERRTDIQRFIFFKGFAVARFGANSGRVYLDCDRSPTNSSSSSLGVRLAPKEIVDAMRQQKTFIQQGKGSRKQKLLSMNPAWLASDVIVESAGTKIDEYDFRRACEIALASGHTTPDKIIEVVQRQMGLSNGGKKMSDELVCRERSVEAYLRELHSLEFPASVNRTEYIVVPSMQQLIAQKQINNGLQFYPTREACASQGLQISRIDVFLTHYINVRDAVLGRTELYTGIGNALERSAGEELWERISTNSLTWLDAVFEKDSEGNFFVETDFKIRRIQLNEGYTEQRSLRRVLLDLPMMQSGYVDLLFNAHGMPLRRALEQKYVRGETLNFIFPVSKCVARFGADSDRAYLNCDRDPSFSNSGLGVLASAEGTSVRAKESRRKIEFDIEVSDAEGEVYVPETHLAGVLGEIEQSGKITSETRELILRRAKERRER